MYINPLTGECEEESTLNTPDKVFWFSVLANAIYAFLNGCQEAADWIFAKDQRWEHSFDELWIMFFEIDPKEVRNALAKRNGGSYVAAQEESIHQRRYQTTGFARRQRTKSRNNRPHRDRHASAKNVRGIENWIEQFLFREHDQGCVAKHGG